jgi:hypothetical protein
MTAATTFTYRTTGDALGTERPAYVLDIPDGLVWGMLPLGWTYYGHTTDGQFDLWHPPHHPGPTDFPRNRLWIPRQFGRGQLEARLEFASNDPHPDDEHRWIPRGYAPDVIWRCTFTTRAEISAALLDLQAIAADPDALAIYTALHAHR